MFKTLFKLSLAIVLFVGIGMSLGTVKASAAVCSGAPYDDWGVHKTTDGGHGGAMAGLKVQTQMSNKSQVNVDYQVSTSMPGGNDKKIFNWPLGNGAKKQEWFRTGETFKNHAADRTYQCDGWSIVGPNTQGRAGNGHVIDCSDSINGSPTATRVWISDIENPEGKKGKWTVLIDGGTGSPDGGTTIPDYMNQPDSLKKFTIVNGDNVRIDMIFTETARSDEVADPKIECNYLYAKSYGDYFTRKTRVHVEVGNVSVKKRTWGVVEKNASGDYENKEQGSNADVYDNISVGKPPDGQEFVPVDSGTLADNQYKLWVYRATSPDISIKVTYQWWNPDYDNTTGPNGAWRPIPTTATTQRIGGVNVTEPAAPNVNKTENCYDLSLTCDITGIYATGPTDRILVNEWVLVTAKITNTGSRPINNPYLTGMGVNSSGAGYLEPDETSGTITAWVRAPATVQDWNLSFTSVIPWVSASGTCGDPATVYRQFGIVPHASLDIAPDEENPTTITYKTWLENTSDTPATINATSEYFKKPAAGGKVYLNPAYDPKGPENVVVPANSNNTLTINEVNRPMPAFVAGDQFCTRITTTYTTGLIGPWGVVVDAEGPGDTGDICRTIHNKPYFKAFGKGVRSTNGFDYGSGCSAASGDAVLASWYNNSPGNRRGSGTELNAMAKFDIVGFASGGIARPTGPLSPTELTFANTVAADTTTPSPKLGGGFGGSDCSTNIAPPAEATTISAPNDVSVTPGTTGSTKYTGGNRKVTINTGTIAPNVSQSIFVEGDIYIDGNITYGTSNPPWNKDNIPSFVLHATGNIYIGSNVTNLDGLYVAKGSPSGGTVSKGRIFTCSLKFGTAFVAWPQNSMYDYCKNQLTVRGAFVAYKVNLMRTYGSLRDSKNNESPRSGTSPGCSNGSSKQTCAAEVFDFSPEFYLSNPAIENPSTSTQQYDSIISLPPVL